MDAFLFPNTPINNRRQEHGYNSTPHLRTSSRYTQPEYELRPTRPNNVTNPPWNEIIQNATHESLMASGNTAYIKLADELRAAQANLEAQMTIANTFRAMLTTHTPTSTEGNLHIQDTEPCLPREECGVNFFTSREWTHYVEQQNNVGITVKKTDFLEKLGGGPVDEARATEFSRRASQVFTHLWRHNHDPTTWGKKSHLVGIFFAATMRKHFMEFRLCEGDWKAEAYATLKYCDFTRNRRNTGSLLKSHPSAKREADSVPPRTHKKARKSHKPTRSVIVKIEPSECIDLTADDDSHREQVPPNSSPSRADSMDLSFPSSPILTSSPHAKTVSPVGSSAALSSQEMVSSSTSCAVADPAPPKYRKFVNPLAGLAVPKVKTTPLMPSSAVNTPPLSTDPQLASGSTLAMDGTNEATCAATSAASTPVATSTTATSTTATSTASATSGTSTTLAPGATPTLLSPSGVDLTTFPAASQPPPGGKKSATLKPSDKKTARNLYARDYLAIHPRTTTVQFKEVWDTLVPMSVKKMYKGLAAKRTDST